MGVEKHLAPLHHGVSIGLLSCLINTYFTQGVTIHQEKVWLIFNVD